MAFLKRPSPSLGGGTRFYNPALDGLRFFAFFLVFLHHAPWVPKSQDFSCPWVFLARVHDFGWIGVDLFLCLSSYLITRLLWMEWQKRGKISISSFYCRRALRIWPLYYLMCFIGFYLMPLYGQDGPAWGSADYDSFLHLFLIPHLAFYANLPIALHHHYVNSMSLGPLWTVSLEEQFYLLCPLLMVLVRFDRKKILVGGLGLLAVTTVLRILFLKAGFTHPAIWVSLPTRLDPFVLGALLAFFEEDLHQATQKVSSWVFAAAGFLGIAGVMVLPGIELDRPSVVWQFSLLDLGWTLLLFSVVRPGLPQKGAALRPFPVLGKISYGLYVYHLFALHLADLAFFWLRLKDRFALDSGSAGWAVSLGGFLLTIGLSALSYEYYEKAFLKLKDRFTFIQSRAV